MSVGSRAPPLHRSASLCAKECLSPYKLALGKVASVVIQSGDTKRACSLPVSPWEGFQAWCTGKLLFFKQRRFAFGGPKYDC